MRITISEDATPLRYDEPAVKLLREEIMKFRADQAKTATQPSEPAPIQSPLDSKSA
jgi:hypothetical protein